MASRIVCWRAGRSRAPAGQQRQPVLQPRQQRRRRTAAVTRAAASSIASGRPSRRAQISAIAGALSAVRAKSGCTACARSTKRRDRLGRVDVSTQRERRHREDALAAHPERRPAGDQHVRPRAVGQQLGQHRRGGDAPARSCRAPASAACRRRCACDATRQRPAIALPQAECWATAARTRSGSRTAASGTKPTPSAKSVPQLAGNVERQAGLADAAGAGQRQQPRLRPAQQVRRPPPRPRPARRTRSRGRGSGGSGSAGGRTRWREEAAGASGARQGDGEIAPGRRERSGRCRRTWWRQGRRAR